MSGEPCMRCEDVEATVCLYGNYWLCAECAKIHEQIKAWPVCVKLGSEPRPPCEADIPF
jgi:hypothetical protein